jgi:hypothetical protein
MDARRWPTLLSQDQFARVTGLAAIPGFLQKDVDKDGKLNVYANGEITYIVQGIYARVSVRWEFEAPPGAGDTHNSRMRGTKANIIICQGPDQNYKPALYVEKAGKTTADQLKRTVQDAVAEIALRYPGISLAQTEKGWQVIIPDSYNVGHEAHFAQATKNYLDYLGKGELPAWEVPNMLAKYYTTTLAYEMCRKGKR